MYKLAFFVPAEHKDKVKAAVFAAGAGRIGNYDSCCWEVSGTGQFRAGYSGYWREDNRNPVLMRFLKFVRERYSLPPLRI